MENIMLRNILAERFPSKKAAMGEIMRLKTMMLLPKGTEYFFSDIHGEDQAFIHLIRSASGNIRRKIRDVYRTRLSEDEQNEIASLIYYPEKILKENKRLTDDKLWVRNKILQLIEVGRFISSKYPRSLIRKKLPDRYQTLIEELFILYDGEIDRRKYYFALIDAILEEDNAYDFICSIAYAIQRISVYHIHVVGDIFDRGPGPDKIIEELISFEDVDIQWGNHDVVWMGAALGNETCMMAVMRNAIKYNTFDVLEDGYSIHLRGLNDFAQKFYGDDPCEFFMPRVYDENVYNIVDKKRAAQMHKAISIIEFKLEGQLLERRPEYQMQNRVVLKKVDWKKMEYIDDDGERFPLRDTNFPTINPDNPLELTKEEKDLVFGIHASFAHSERLQRHVKFLFTNGSSYKTMNGNLLYHGCVPLTEDGEFDGIEFNKKWYAGKELFDYVDYMMTRAFYGPSEMENDREAIDFIWYLWCGAKSPMFGKARMSSFENYFIGSKKLAHEPMNPYFELCDNEKIVDKILTEFGLPLEYAHIINGHVPVKIKDGQTPDRANGKLFVIDGGIAKSYHKRTGIAGYTLIYNSHHIALAEHQDFEGLTHELETYSPHVETVDRYPYRVLIGHTDEGQEYEEIIKALHKLIEAYNLGILKEDLSF